MSSRQQDVSSSEIQSRATPETLNVRWTSINGINKKCSSKSVKMIFLVSPQYIKINSACFHEDKETKKANEVSARNPNHYKSRIIIEANIWYYIRRVTTILIFLLVIEYLIFDGATLRIGRGGNVGHFTLGLFFLVLNFFYRDFFSRDSFIMTPVEMTYWVYKLIRLSVNRLCFATCNSIDYII
ncbi:hypothetical protein AGLY_006329 [Aphis glycines]|uniref:Uncharacterized protein n=1 Tax=Aphis glycines TaxID=307491 RepID=A0A6G0TR82_APHGL|nr:hypothetical protein AGLY_006329 [Aphis glycines]